MTKNPPQPPCALDGLGWRCLFAAVLLLASTLAWPAQAAEWSPPPPAPDQHDWVQLTSGEWLKGEIKVIYKDTLEFDSEKLDLLKLDMDDVKTIRSGRILSVRVVGDRVATGKMLVENGRIEVQGDAPQVFQRDALLSVTSGEPKERNYWSGNVSVGGNFRSGNSDQTDINVMVNAQRRTVEDRVALDYLGNYSVADSVQSANNHRANAVWDRFVSERLFLRPVFGQYYRDPFQNISQRFTVGTGIGYELVDTKDTGWNVFAGPAYQYTQFSDVQPGESSSEGSPALSAGTNFNTKLTTALDFTYGYQFQLTNEAAGRYNHHMIGTFGLDVTDDIDLKISLIWNRTAKPKTEADGTTPKPDDYQLIFGVGYNF